MPVSPLISLIDQRKFRELFRDHLYWSNPDQPPLQVLVDGVHYKVEQVAGFKGLRVWYCAQLPSKQIQRLIDLQIGAQSHERLVIFADEHAQAWRWPRRAQLGGANAKLVMHEYKVGSEDRRLIRQLEAIKIGLDEDLKLPDLLARMRATFDQEAETASAQAARFMGGLYAELDNAGWDERNATLLLARLLFLWFADDTAMWRRGVHGDPPPLFQSFVSAHTSTTTLAADLATLFEILDTDESRRPPSTPPELAAFRYVNGGLFSEPLQMARLTADFRDQVMEAGEFDWSIISPAVFGSMFQTVNDKKSRRAAGEHYTTEESILKTIGPLFLDEFRGRLESSRNDRGQLTKLHNDLGRVRVMDPACGCGNFLIVAYRELRAIEQDLLLAKRDLDIAEKGATSAPQSVDITLDLMVSLDHFFGIEINEWPARIAETAMLLVDHQANLRMQDDFGIVPDRLPIKIAPKIVHANALRVDWASVVGPSESLVILGNPPFLGDTSRSEEQKQDLHTVWGRDDTGRLDYVTGWYAKTLALFRRKGYAGCFAFVSTNSITQGEPVPSLFHPIFDDGWRIRFAHRTFDWTSEAPDAAAVHCVVLGFDKRERPAPRLFDYPDGAAGPTELEVSGKINAYLIDGPNVIVEASRAPIAPDLPPTAFGNKPTDGGHLVVDPEDYEQFAQDPVAGKYLRPYVGARELIHAEPRWVLWLVNATAEDLAASPLMRGRVEAVRDFRAKSKAPSTREWAARPHPFKQFAHRDVPHLVIPRVSSENRQFIPTALEGAEVIPSDANFTAEDPDGVAFGVISSSAFLAWQKAVGGRLKSDMRFSNTLTWNTFPLPKLTGRRRTALIAAAGQLSAAREQFPGESLATLYEPGRTPELVLAAHAAVDAVVDAAIGIKEGATIDDRQRVLLRRYAAITEQDAGDATLFDVDGELDT